MPLSEEGLECQAESLSAVCGCYSVTYRRYPSLRAPVAQAKTVHLRERHAQPLELTKLRQGVHLHIILRGPGAMHVTPRTL